jgi:hypothetical protein
VEGEDFINERRADAERVGHLANRAVAAEGGC